MGFFNTSALDEITQTQHGGYETKLTNVAL